MSLILTKEFTQKVSAVLEPFQSQDIHSYFPREKIAVLDLQCSNKHISKSNNAMALKPSHFYTFSSKIIYMLKKEDQESNAIMKIKMDYLKEVQP